MFILPFFVHYFNFSHNCWPYCCDFFYFFLVLLLSHLRIPGKAKRPPTGYFFGGLGKIVFFGNFSGNAPRLFQIQKKEMFEIEKGALDCPHLVRDCHHRHCIVCVSVQLRILSLLLRCHHFPSDEKSASRHYICWLVTQQLLIRRNNRKAFQTCSASAVRLLAWTSPSTRL